LPGAAFFALALVIARPASAQDTVPPDTSSARVVTGPLAIRPIIELTNLGVDTNVFNEPGDAARRDFTFTVTPKAQAWLKFGPTWITGTAKEDLVWYQTYSSERAANHLLGLGWIVPLNRLSFGLSATYVNARERPGFEIDTRTRRTEPVFRGRVEYRALARTFVGFSAGRQQVSFAEDARYLDSNLRFELNRTVTSAAVSVRHQLTPLTAITADAGRQHDAFEFSSLRDSDSTTAGLQVTFDPSALIKGTARVGYRDFQPGDASLAGYRGSTAAVDLAYVLMGSTRFGLQVARDVQYSYDINQPYYVQTGVGGSIAQQIYGPLDAVVRAGAQHLASRNRVGALILFLDRTDDVHSYGVGAGYHFGTELRLGFNVDRQRRITEVTGHEYRSLRVGVALTYGF
jgi:hypothetical protein